MTATLYTYVATYASGLPGDRIPCGDDIARARRICEAMSGARRALHVTLYRNADVIGTVRRRIWDQGNSSFRPSSV